MATRRKVEIELKASNKASSEIKKVGGNIDQLGDKAGALGGALATAFSVKKIVDFGAALTEAYFAQERAELSVLAGVKRLGQETDVVHRTLLNFARDLQAKTIFGDEEILQGVIAQLLTFRSIGGEVFERTAGLALDLSAILGTDLQSSAIQLGKALNDPATGLSMLSRSGITFSESFKDMIKELVAGGELFKAQSLILDEIEAQYGGLAETLANSASGAAKQFSHDLSDLKESFGALIAEALQPVIKDLGKVVDYLIELPGWAKATILAIVGITTAVLAGTLAIKALTVAFGAFNVMTGGILLAIGAAITGLTLLIVFLARNFDKVKHVAISFFDAIKTSAQIAASWLVEKFGGAIDIVITAIKSLVGAWNKIPDWLRPGSKVDLSGFDNIRQKLKDFGTGETRQQLLSDLAQRQGQRDRELARKLAESKADESAAANPDQVVFPEAQAVDGPAIETKKDKEAKETKRAHGIDQVAVMVNLFMRLIEVNSEQLAEDKKTNQILMGGRQNNLGNHQFNQLGGVANFQ